MDDFNFDMFIFDCFKVFMIEIVYFDYEEDESLSDGMINFVLGL